MEYNDNEFVKHIRSFKFDIPNLSKEAKDFFINNKNIRKNVDGSVPQLDNLKNNIKIVNKTDEFTLISDEISDKGFYYSSLQNDGGEINVSESQIKFFKAQIAMNKNKGNIREADKWIAILSKAKKDSKIIIPPKNFLFDSKILINKLISIINKKIFKI